MAGRVTLTAGLLLGLPGCAPGVDDVFRPAPTQVRSAAVDEAAELYFAGPWPDDRRLVNGRVSLARFPRPGLGAFQETFFATAEGVLDGWGLQSPIYVPVSGPVDPTSLPRTVGASTAAGASVLLVAVDPDADGYARPHPVEVRFLAAPTLYLPGNILVVRPSPGSPLEPATRYALIVTTAVTDPSGEAVGPEASLFEALRGDQEPGPTLRPVLDALGLPLSRVAGAFLFTTQGLMDELVTLRQFLAARPAPALSTVSEVGEVAGFTWLEGTYPAPLLQHGTLPFALAGGEFRFDGGTPRVAAVEQLRVALCVPDGPVPAAGFPVVMYSHGTGGSFRSIVNDICPELAAVGLAGAGIDQVFHGPRGGGGGGCFGQPVELCFFNPINTVAGRNNARQAALDFVSLRRMLENAQLQVAGRTVRFDLSRPGYFGHSQGGLSGALYAAVEDRLAMAVLSGAGGHLTTTVLERKQPFDVKALAEGALLFGLEGLEPLTDVHPVLAVVQMLGDAADPAGYGRYLVRRPQGGPKHLYLTSGLDDPFTPPFTAEVLAASAGVPQLTPVGRVSTPHGVAGIAPVSLPVLDSVRAADGRTATAVFRQFPMQGHFLVFDDASARSQWQLMLRAALTGDAVVLR